MHTPAAAIDNPFEYTHVLAKAWPDELTLLIGAEPIHVEHARRIGEVFADGEPVSKIVADVIATEWQHSERIAPYFTHLAGRSGGLLRAHRCSLVDAVLPARRLDHQGNGIAPPCSEDESGDRESIGVVPVRIERWAALEAHRETRIRVRSFSSAARCPGFPLPIGQVRRRLARHAFPPYIAIIGQRDIGE